MNSKSFRSTILTSMLFVSASTGACLSSVEPPLIPLDDATVDFDGSEASPDAVVDQRSEEISAEGSADALADGSFDTSADSTLETSNDAYALDGGIDAVLDIGLPDSAESDVGIADTALMDAAPDTGLDAAPDAPMDANTPNTVYPSDVSILYPLPSAPSNLLGADAAEVHGALLPKSSYVKMIYSTEADGGRVERPLDAQQPDSNYEHLRLVGVRLDPCSKRNTATCRTEVRAVFQTISTLANGNVEAHDGAVHIFYDVPGPELVNMLREILALKNAQVSPGVFPSVNGLGVHPTLALQGTEGPFAVGLRTILLSHIGNARIGRITFFDADIFGTPTWVFKSFDYVASTPVQVVLPHFDSRGGAIEQVVFGSLPSVSASTADVNGFAIPESDATDKVEGVSDLPRPAKGQPPSVAVLNAFAAAVRIQDPDVHNSESIDCSNCHLAEGAIAVGKTHFSLLPSPSPTLQALDTRYVRQDDAVTNLHAFGYLGRNVSVMQRTANESATVAAKMQSML